MPRSKRVSEFKGKKPTVQSKGGGTREHEAGLTRMEIAEGNLAAERLKHRPTKDFSTKELGALMQIAPGEAEPHQVATPRQFKAS